MKIAVKNLSFKYTEKALFNNLSVDLEGTKRPLVILGPSGSGKTTLLKLIAGLLKPQEGDVFYTGESDKDDFDLGEKPKTAFIFQESRLLPWLTVLENVSLPLYKDFGQQEAQEKAKHFLSLVSMSGKEGVYPAQLSGGEAQRVSMARAFAWPAPVLLMDEPFQALDIPLRINLMDLVLSFLKEEKRLMLAVTHDPREAIYLGGRILILGQAGKGIVYDKPVELSAEDRALGSAAARELEREMMEALGSSL